MVVVDVSEIGGQFSSEPCTFACELARIVARWIGRTAPAGHGRGIEAPAPPPISTATRNARRKSLRFTKQLAVLTATLGNAVHARRFLTSEQLPVFPVAKIRSRARANFQRVAYPRNHGVHWRFSAAG